MNAKYLRKHCNGDTNSLLVYVSPVKPTTVVGTPRLQLTVYGKVPLYRYTQNKNICIHYSNLACQYLKLVEGNMAHLITQLA